MLLLAAALDAALGDPPTALHPVGWLGRAVRAVERRAPGDPHSRRRFGMVWAVAFPAAAAAVGLGAMRVLRGSAGRLLVEAAALDSTFAMRTLFARADEVRRALERDDLPAARALLARHLVSRETADLSVAEVAAATIESVAENLSDGVIAPWMAHAALGLPGALAYRAINTLDAMWGYRTPDYVDLGRAAARLDDAANLLPARATALAIVLAAGVAGEDAPGALRTWMHDAGETASPNAGRPMTAMAGALGVVLAKRDAYILGIGGRTARATDIARAIRVARLAATIAGLGLLGPLLRGRCRAAATDGASAR